MSVKNLAAAPARSGLSTAPHALELSPEKVEYYHSIQKRFLNPIVEMRNGVCLGCFMVLSSHQQQMVKCDDGYGICESCGRILYYEGF
jgi:predicted  nucleic acid-binding Zn-ribbon protein